MRQRRAVLLVVGALTLAAGCGTGSTTRTADPTIAAGATFEVHDASARSEVRDQHGWPTAMASAAHQNRTLVEGPTDGHLRWTRQLGGPVVPGPVVAPDGSILIAANDGRLHAIDQATGEDRWTFDGGAAYGNDLSTSPTVTADGTVLWPGPRSTLYALDGTSGEERWTVDLDGAGLSPVVNADRTRVYVTDASAILRAISLRPGEGGRLLWKLDLGGGRSYGSPALGADGSIYTTSGPDLVAIDDADRVGEVRWRFSTGELIEVSPAVASDGTVVVGSNDGYQYGIRPDGAMRWRFASENISYSSSVTTPDGLDWFGNNNGVLFAVDVETGHEVLRYSVPHRDHDNGIWTAPVVDAVRNVYFGTDDGHIYGFDRAGTPLLDIDTGASVDSYPALTDDGTLLIGSSNGSFYALHS